MPSTTLDSGPRFIRSSIGALYTRIGPYVVEKSSNLLLVTFIDVSDQKTKYTSDPERSLLLPEVYPLMLGFSFCELEPVFVSLHELGFTPPVFEHLFIVNLLTFGTV